MIVVKRSTLMLLDCSAAMGVAAAVVALSVIASIPGAKLIMVDSRVTFLVVSSSACSVSKRNRGTLNSSQLAVHHWFLSSLHHQPGTWWYARSMAIEAVGTAVGT